jgi:uncharacterized protein YecE (DUF72 family)
MGLFTQSFPATIVGADPGQISRQHWPTPAAALAKSLLTINHMNEDMPPGLWSGTSGLVLPLPNKDAFPEAFRDRPRLTYYASLFNSIEVNSTFYKIPMPGTFTRWVTEVPPHFKFTVKLWRGITHAPGLRFDSQDVCRFLAAADRLEDKKGALLIQLPPALHADTSGQLEQLLAAIRASDPNHSWKLAVEFRHRSWYSPQINSILTRHHAGRVLHDMPSSAVSELPADHPTIPFVYLRFHGPGGDYKGGYTATQLNAWAERIRVWLAGEKDVFVYFNNTIGDALADLSRLHSLLPVLQ